MSQSSSPDNTLCHGHLLCLPDQPYLTAHTNLWDSGCRQRPQHSSSGKGGASATLLTMCEWLEQSRTEPLYREYQSFCPECQNHWILCTEARIHLEQLPLNLLTEKCQALYMGSKERPLRDGTTQVPPFPVSTPKESWVWKGAAPPCRHGGDLLNTPLCWSLASEKQRTMSSV